VTSGFLFLDKKAGETSTDYDRKAKRLFPSTRCGHLGTLDPFASGLLILALGDATGLFPYLDEGRKTYEAVLLLGEETDTLDPTGTVVQKSEVPPLTVSEIQASFSSFLGEKEQVPPSFSAVHVHGKRAYDLARKGESVPLPPRKVRIDSLALLSYDEGKRQISFRTTVSKGTYIRSLGRDIALSLHTVGSLLSLRRTQIGPYSVKDARPLEDYLRSGPVPMPALFPESPVVEIPETKRKSAENGNPLRLNSAARRLFVSFNGVLLGFYERRDDGLYHCIRGFHHED